MPLHVKYYIAKEIGGRLVYLTSMGPSSVSKMDLWWNDGSLATALPFTHVEALVALRICYDDWEISSAKLVGIPHD